MEDESARLRQPQIDREPCRTEAGVSAERSLGPVAVIVAHPDVPLPDRLQKNDSVRANPGATGRERLYGLLVLEMCGSAVRGIEHHEVIAGSGHLVEVLAFGARHQILPVKPHQRRRQTIQIASRTIFFDILLTPSVRSTKMIGISKRRNPRFHALKDISI